MLNRREKEAARLRGARGGGPIGFRGKKRKVLFSARDGRWRKGPFCSVEERPRREKGVFEDEKNGRSPEGGGVM